MHKRLGLCGKVVNLQVRLEPFSTPVKRKRALVHVSTQSVFVVAKSAFVVTAIGGLRLFVRVRRRLPQVHLAAIPADVLWRVGRLIIGASKARRTLDSLLRSRCHMKRTGEQSVSEACPIVLFIYNAPAPTPIALHTWITPRTGSTKKWTTAL